MKNFFNKYKYQLLLFIVVSVLFFVNYKSGTYLSGWDNLQTELNPGLAVKRAFFSVWEEYQSFGLTAGMAHAADLPRAVFLWIMSFIIPQNMIRYFYHFLMLLLGGMGAFVLFKKTSAVNAFFGALFYMLNLGTVQIFYLPFESFSTFFALLPWGIWAFLFVIARNIVTKQSQKEFATSPSAPRDDNVGKLARLIIKGIEGKTVATIDASGSASFTGKISASEASISGRPNQVFVPALHRVREPVDGRSSSRMYR